MSRLDWKKYIWYENNKGDIFDLPYENNTKSNIEYLYELALRHTKCGTSRFEVNNVEYVPGRVRFLFNLDNENHFVEFMFSSYFNDAFVIRYASHNFKCELKNFTFGKLLALMVSVRDALNTKKEINVFDVLRDRLMGVTINSLFTYPSLLKGATV